MVANPASRQPVEPAHDASIFEAYAPGPEAVAIAPMYQNAALGGSRLFGETRLQVVGPDLEVTARRMRRGTPFLVLTGVVLGVFAFVGLLLYGMFLFTASTSGVAADDELLRSTLTGSAAIAAVAIACYVGGLLLSAGRPQETVTVALVDTSGRKAGRRFVVGLPIGRKGHQRRLVLKPAGKADTARLREVVEATGR